MPDPAFHVGDRGVYLCSGCGEVLTMARADGTTLCAWCYCEYIIDSGRSEIEGEMSNRDEVNA
jgi:hypothetical protein